MNAKIEYDESNNVISVICANCGEFLGFAAQKNNNEPWKCTNCKKLNQITLPEKYPKTIWDWLNERG